MPEDTFDFDPSPILGKLDELTDKFSGLYDAMESDRGSDALGGIDDNVQKATKSTKDFGTEGSMSLKKMLVTAGLLTGAFFAIKGAFAALPVVQDAFFALGEIVKHNLLAPIMQELLPTLNSILAWAVENRTVFVAVGAVIGNVFTTVIEIVKAFVKIGQRLFGGLIAKFQETFGATSSGIGDMLRLLMTKIVVVIGFLTLMLEPVIDTLTNIFGILFEHVGKLMPMIMSAFSEIGETLSEVFEMFGEFFTENQDVFEGIIGFLTIIAAIIITVAKLAWKLLKPFIRLGLLIAGSIIKGFRAIGRVVSSLFGDISFDGILQGIEKIGDWIDENFIQPIGGMLDWLEKRFDSFFGWIDKGIDKLRKFNILGRKTDEDTDDDDAGGGSESNRNRGGGNNNIGGGSESNRSRGGGNNNRGGGGMSLSPTTNNSSRNTTNKFNINMVNNQTVTGENAEAVSSRVANMIVEKTKKGLSETLDDEATAEGI